MDDLNDPREAFAFRVSIEGISDPFMVSEMSGLETSFETETVVEGGENRFVHKLPKAAKHPNLVLKHFVLPASGPVLAWLRSVFEGDFSTPIAPKIVTVELMDPDNTPLRVWTVTNAYPVKWRVGGPGSTPSDVAVETVELAYATLTRS